MRRYDQFERYLNKLSNQIYEQPPDIGHTSWAIDVIDKWISQMPTCTSVLDVGCGSGFCKPLFEKYGKTWAGVTLGRDAIICEQNEISPVFNADFSFLDMIEKESYDLVFSRHSLEHSPFPILTLMEWYRVSKQWLCVILPNPMFWTVRGQNHYSVVYPDQAKWNFEQSGWGIIWEDHTPEEMRYMLEKQR